MKKRNTFSYETVKAHFDPAAESEGCDAYFRVNGGPVPVTLPVPRSVMYRLFRLGQAYGIRQLRYMESESRFIVGNVEVPGFVSDLQRLKGLVNDEVLHEWVDQLLAELESGPGSGAKHVAVSTGSFRDFTEGRQWR